MIQNHLQPLQGRVPRPPRIGREVVTEYAREARRQQQLPSPGRDLGLPPEVGCKLKVSVGTAGRDGWGI